jgi:hypothetical protein
MHNDYFADLSFRPKSTLQPHPRPSLYDGDHPFMDDPRDALRLDIRSTLTKRDFEIPGLAPQVEYTYSKTGRTRRSTVSRRMAPA